MADLPLPELVQLRERIRDLEDEVQRLRHSRVDAASLLVRKPFGAEPLVAAVARARNSRA